MFYFPEIVKNNKKKNRKLKNKNNEQLNQKFIEEIYSFLELKESLSIKLDTKMIYDHINDD